MYVLQYPPPPQSIEVDFAGLAATHSNPTHPNIEKLRTPTDIGEKYGK